MPKISASRNMTKEKNKAIVNGGIIKNVTIAKINDAGDVVISAKNLYMLEIIKKALQLKKIGFNFVVDKKYNDKLEILGNYTEVMNSEYDATKFYFKDEEFINLLMLVNLKLADRQIFARYNKNKELIVKIYDYDSRLRQIFIRDKNSTSVKSIPVMDLETREIHTIEETTRKGMFLLCDDEKSTEFLNGWDYQLTLIEQKIAGFIDSMKSLDDKGIQTSEDDEVKEA